MRDHLIAVIRIVDNAHLARIADEREKASKKGGRKAPQKGMRGRG